ncbi:cyclic pyranopterin monophosphate synthase MoaC [soil metagenome]
MSDSARLTHLDAEGHARMVDVGGKVVTTREAKASAVVRLRPATARMLVEGRLPKGDALATARLAGIMGAKRTPDLIPLCHVIALAGVEVAIDVDVDAGRVAITATARAADRTGVEIEALVAASTTALTLYDMTKAVEKGAVIEHVRLESKTGGKSGDWHREDDRDPEESP